MCKALVVSIVEKVTKAPAKAATDDQFMALCRDVGMQMGLTKVFFQQKAFNSIERLRYGERLLSFLVCDQKSLNVFLFLFFFRTATLYTVVSCFVSFFGPASGLILEGGGWLSGHVAFVVISFLFFLLLRPSSNSCFPNIVGLFPSVRNGSVPCLSPLVTCTYNSVPIIHIHRVYMCTKYHPIIHHGAKNRICNQLFFFHQPNHPRHPSSSVTMCPPITPPCTIYRPSTVTRYTGYSKTNDPHRSITPSNVRHTPSTAVYLSPIVRTVKAFSHLGQTMIYLSTDRSSSSSAICLAVGRGCAGSVYGTVPTQKT